MQRVEHSGTPSARYEVDDEVKDDLQWMCRMKSTWSSIHQCLLATRYAQRGRGAGTATEVICRHRISYACGLSANGGNGQDRQL